MRSCNRNSESNTKDDCKQAYKIKVILLQRYKNNNSINAGGSRSLLPALLIG